MKYNRFNKIYGMDNLNHFLFCIYIIILLLNLFINFNSIVYIELILVFIILFRLLSKNIIKRKRENDKFIKIKNKVKLIFKIKKYDSNYVYIKCKACNKKLRLALPDKIGIKHTKCPSCNKKISFVCLRKFKQEIIVNNKKVKL